MVEYDLGNGRKVYRFEKPSPPPARSDLPIPMHIRDEMDPGVHPYDGREYTSKAAWRKANVMGGYVEVGNDPQRFKTPERKKPDRKAIRESLHRAKAKVEAGHRPGRS